MVFVFWNSYGLIAKCFQNGGHHLERNNVNEVHITCILYNQQLGENYKHNLRP